MNGGDVTLLGGDKTPHNIYKKLLDYWSYLSEKQGNNNHVKSS